MAWKYQHVYIGLIKYVASNCYILQLDHSALHRSGLWIDMTVHVPNTYSLKQYEVLKFNWNEKIWMHLTVYF
jgi:hypothetical protein